MKRLAISLVFFALAAPIAKAHHSWLADYSRDDIVEIEGEVASIVWRNPHVRFNVVVDKGTDDEQVWDIAGTSVSNLARMDVTKDILSDGDRVRMAGHASKNSDHGMYMINLLLPDGREAVFSTSATPRWPGERIGSAESLRGEQPVTDLAERPDSIFAVWTTLLGVAESRGLHARSTSDYPLTELGLQRVAEYDVETDNPFGNCSPKGGSAIMDAPYPMELVDQGDEILLKLEEYDTVRTIHLTEIHDDSDVEASLLGYSTGRWQDDSLIITTTKIDYPFLHVGSQPDFIPQSEYAQTQETFRLDEARDKLHYTLTVTDTAMLTKPMVFNKYYAWNPDETLQPYLCDEG